MSVGRDVSGIQAVKTSLEILETIAGSSGGIGVTQISDAVRLPKGSVYRHLQTLVDCGYLTQHPVTSRYELGAKSRLLSRQSPEIDLVQAADRPMRALRDRLGQTVALSEMTARGALVLATLVGSSPIEIVIRIGSELPFHSSAQGKVLLAFAPRPVQERELNRSLRAFSSKTKTSRSQLEEELVRIRKLGYASAAEEMFVGLNATAVGIFDARNNCVGAIAIIGAIQFVPGMPDKRSLSALTEAAQQISKALGYRPLGQGPDAKAAASLRRPSRTPAGAKRRAR